MRRLLIAAFACITASGSGAALSAAPGSTSSVSYQVTPELEAGRLVDLKVDVALKGDADGTTRMRLPDRWSGAENLWRAVHDVTATGGRVRKLSDAEVEVSHAPNAPIVLSYKVKQDFRGELATDAGPPFRAVVKADRFTVLGWALFAEVAGPRGRATSFRWGPTPAGWTVASDLDHPGKVHDTGDLLDSVLVGGSDLDILETEAAGGRIRIAVHGDWKFTPAQLSSLISRIAETSSDFWGDRGEDFFVAVTPMVSPGGGAQYGVGLGDAFSLWSTTDVDEPGLRHIVAHEHQHVWFPTRVGGVRTGSDEPLDYWLSEGFTDFYTLRLLLRSGLWTPEEFVADYNRILKDYANSPVIGAPNSIMPVGFWEDPAVADLPYQRGLVLATLWDHRLRATTSGARDLDDVVLNMRQRASGQTNQGNAVENLRLSYGHFGGSLDADYRDLVEAGRPVLLPADLFGDCATVVTSHVRAFDRGFDSARTNASGGVVTGVDPEGPAYAAGLRNGMRIIARIGSGAEQDSRTELTYQVRDRQADKVIRYRPQGSRMVNLQEVMLKPGMNSAQHAACARSMSGG